MCGICGFLTFKNEIPDEKTLRKMNETIRHRGPDHEGYHLFPGVALGHRRLSIIDLKGGDQPIYNEDKKIAVVFNGEIYNFKKLRALTEKLGHHYTTNTDTEVLVHLYEEFGTDFIEKLNGMFSFALWDSEKEILIGARDRIGKKPFYYGEFGGQFIFGSEIKALLAHPDVSRELDLQSLAKYLTFEYVPSPASIFKGIKKLPPGHLITVRNGGIGVSSYWDFHYRYGEDQNNKTEKECAADIRRILRDSVERRLISDVPLGVFLSGGIDSSAVVAMMAELIPAKDIKTFSVGFKEASFDESSHARRVAEIFGTDHHEQQLDVSKMLELAPRVAEILDEPMADPSIIPTFLLSKFTRENVTVALGGDGGDELFAGYPTFLAHKFAGHYDKMPGFIHSLIKKVSGLLPSSSRNFSLDFKIKRFISGKGLPPEIRNQIWLGALSPERSAELLAFDAGRFLDNENVFADLTRHSKNSNATNLIDLMLYHYLKLYLPEEVLTKVDRASMANSLEVRAPFLDAEMVEYSAGLPIKLKLNGFQTKYILKKSLQKTLPDDILFRKKKGFGIPVTKWFREDLRSFLSDLFSREKIERRGLFRHSEIKKLLEEHWSGKHDRRKELWTLMVFRLWEDKYLPI